MAYVGQGIKGGTFSVLDTSGNTYNGSNVTFNLGTQVSSPAQLLVSHDGVIQKPVTDYTLATGSTGGGGLGGAYRHTVSFNDIGYEFGSNFVDSPNTTSAIEYKLYHRVGDSGHTGYLGLDGTHHMTAMEIGA